MKSKTALLPLVILFGLQLLGLTPRLHAQGNDLVVINVDGKLETIVGYQIKLKSEDDKDYMAVVDPQDTTFKYVGTAELKFLSQGMMVRFTAAFNQTGSANAPIKELEIFNQVRQRRMRPEQVQDLTPGIYPVKKDDDKVAAAPQGFENYRIVGRVSGIQGEKLQISTGGRNLIVDADPEIVINVSSIDPTFCQEGDEISVSGLTVSAQPNWIQASTITVTGAKPLAPPEQKTRATRGKQDAKPLKKPAADPK